MSETPRLTKEQAEAVDEDARIVCETGLHCRESERLARLRILDLKAENAALRAALGNPLGGTPAGKE